MQHKPKRMDEYGRASTDGGVRASLTSALCQLRNYHSKKAIPWNFTSNPHNMVEAKLPLLGDQASLSFTHPTPLKQMLPRNGAAVCLVTAYCRQIVVTGRKGTRFAGFREIERTSSCLSIRIPIAKSTYCKFSPQYFRFLRLLHATAWQSSSSMAGRFATPRHTKKYTAREKESNAGCNYTCVASARN